MADSPLELYEKAYRLHYENKSISGACDVYEQIIREFPESNESGYAVIQLEKIRANKALEGIHDNMPAARVHPLQIVSLILNLIVAALLVAASVFYISNRSADRTYLENVSQAVVKISAGQLDAALKTLAELKLSARGDLTPFALTADVYARAGKYDEALGEYDRYARQYPRNPVPLDAVTALQKMRVAATASPSRQNAPALAIVQEEPPTEDLQEAVPEEKPAPRPVRPAPKPKAAAKSSLAKDSVSFF